MTMDNSIHTTFLDADNELLITLTIATIHAIIISNTTIIIISGKPGIINSPLYSIIYVLYIFCNEKIKGVPILTHVILRQSLRISPPPLSPPLNERVKLTGL